VQPFLFLLQLPMALMVAYLDCLSVGALLWRRSLPPAERRTRFAVLVPAHNEEQLLPRLLESLANLGYPADCYDVYVVADNCTDGTARVAGQVRNGLQPTVFERRDEHNLGKGHALTWLLDRIRERAGALEAPPAYDAYAFVDADSVVSINFLEVMDRHITRGDAAIQCYYGVLNPGGSWASALRQAALALFNDLRPRGRDAIGLSAGLRGNGMCFSAATIERFGWDSFALAEDAEFHLTLVQGGICVTYAPEATVLGEMPVSLRQARSQNVRWERGRLQLLRRHGPAMLATALRRRNPAILDALTEQLVPPLSVLTAATTAWFIFSRFVGRGGVRALASGVMIGQLGYVLTGLWLVRARPRVYVALLGAPVYIVWKVWIYLLAAVNLGDARWVRTSRSAE